MTPLLAFIKPAWHFPVVVPIGTWRIPIHPLCDVLAYSIGFRFYLYLSKRSCGLALSAEQHAWIFLGCLFGAITGSKILAWSEAPALYWALRHDPNFWFGGKTIVGGLLGGWAGIEIAKKALGLSGSTGDACVFPIILGMCIGRVGCFLTGLSDNTCGTPSSLPWAVDYGDGIPRHPAQIYEILFLLALGTALWAHRAALQIAGLPFRWFLLSYLGFRFTIDFFKPHFTLFAGFSGIQYGCLAGIVVCAYSIMKLSEQPAPENSHG